MPAPFRVLIIDGVPRPRQSDGLGGMNKRDFSGGLVPATDLNAMTAMRSLQQ